MPFENDLFQRIDSPGKRNRVRRLCSSPGGRFAGALIEGVSACGNNSGVPFAPADAADFLSLSSSSLVCTVAGELVALPSFVKQSSHNN